MTLLRLYWDSQALRYILSLYVCKVYRQSQLQSKYNYRKVDFNTDVELNNNLQQWHILAIKEKE